MVKELYYYRKRHNPKSKAYQNMLVQLNKYIEKGYTFKFWNGYEYVNDGKIAGHIREVHLYNKDKTLVITFF